MAHTDRKSFLQQAAVTLLSGTPEMEYNDPSNKKLPRHLSKTSTGITPYAGTFGTAEVFHLLRRTLTGVSKSDIEFFKTKTMSDAVDYLLTLPANPPPPPVNTYSYNANLSDPNVPIGQTWVNAPANGTLEFARRQSLKAWWMGLHLSPERSIREKMTLFWHNHFSTEMNTVQDSRYLYKYNALLRANCLGDFKAFVSAITLDPAMLVYLNGEDNTKNAPDENYGRELQELFTIGKDLASHYTEDDVKAAARVLTGWRNNRNGIASFFDLTRHDTGNKQFSSFYSNTVITGRNTSTAGIDELNDMLTMIFNHDEVAKYICRKLYRYYVYYVIDESVELNVIEPLAEVFRDSGYNIKTVMSTLLKSEHFFDPLNQGCVIKAPLDFLTGASRAMNLQFPDASLLQAQYSHWLYLQQYGFAIGQDLGDPPNVAGWPAYYEDPQYYEMWINADSLPKRNLFNDMMVYTGNNRNGFKLIYDCIAFANQFSDPGDPNKLISEITQLFYPVDISQTTKDTLKVSFLLSGQSSDSYWTTAWVTYVNNPSDTNAKNTVNSRLQGLLKYLFGLAEYQLA
ncbi:MAG: DUF1800 domain-containing protein [Bacteroidia bacterium]|jgi:uncharacterized protein (DUF1800 family)